MTKGELQERINKIAQERDEFIENANKDVAFFNGKIAALTELLSEMETQPETAVNGEVKEPA